MPNDTQANEAVADTAQSADTTAAATEAQASAAEASTEGADNPNTETTTEETGKQQEEQPRDEQGKFKSNVQKRIDDLTFKRNEAEREAARLRQELAAYKAAKPPKPNEFDSDEEYQEAALNYRIEDGVNRGLAKTAEARAEQYGKVAAEAAGEAYNQRVAEATSRIPDFAEVVGKSDIQISAALQEALRDSEKGPDLVYHLAKNPAEAERLSSMSVRQMDREIGRLEQTIGSVAKPTPPAARTTSAPPPARPGSAASSPASTDPEKMNAKEFEAWMKSQGSKYV